MHGTTALAYQSKLDECSAKRSIEYDTFPNHQTSNRPSVPNHSGDTEMNFTRTNLDRTAPGTNTPNSSHDADIIFIKEWARRYSAKEGAELAGMTPKGFQKIQLGENAISYKRLTQWMKRDPDFAAAHAAHVGLILPGEAGYAGAITRAHNAYVQMKAGQR